MGKWANTGWIVQYSDFQDLSSGGPAGRGVTAGHRDRTPAHPSGRQEELQAWVSRPL